MKVQVAPACVLNKSIPSAFRERLGCAEPNLYASALPLVGDKAPRLRGCEKTP